MKILFLNQAQYNQRPVNNSTVSFKGIPQGLKADAVEFSKKVAEEIIPKNIKLLNVNTQKQEVFLLEKGLAQVQKVIDETVSVYSGHIEPMKISYNPENKGIIFKKVRNAKTGEIKKIPMEVNILETTLHDFETVFHFMKPDMSKELGHAILHDYSSIKGSDFFKHHYGRGPHLRYRPKLGIKNPIVTEFVHNGDRQKYSGMGDLTDRLSVEYCLRKGIEPSVTSLATGNSLVARYKEGRRFVPLSKNDTGADAFKAKYNTLDPNKAMEQIIEKSKGKKIKSSGFDMTVMYLPENKIAEYTKMAQTSPILHV